MQSLRYKLTEFFIIFFVLPISMALPFLIWIKLGIGALGFVYIIFVLLKIEGKIFKISKKLNWKTFWKETAIKFIFIALITTLFVWFTAKADLFSIVLNKPYKWLLFLFYLHFLVCLPTGINLQTFLFSTLWRTV